MFSLYRFMDPYFSHHRDHVPYPYNQYTSWEGRTPQVKLEPSKQPLYFGPYPYDGSSSHSTPDDFNVLCNHGYPPGYYSYRPPYPHVQPPPQLYYHGPYPRYPDAYPAFFVPPHHYSADQAQYEYDKGRSHCCGCPNHVCHRGHNSSVRIEEQKPEFEQNNSESSGLIHFPNYPYPVVWVSPSYLKDSKKNSEGQREPSSGWFPLDMGNLKGLRLGGDEAGRVKSGQKVTPSPWPIIWIPGHGKPEEEVKDLKEIKVNPEIREEVPSPKVKIVPLTYADDEKLEKPGASKDQDKSSVHPEAVKEEGTIKSIPVTQKKEDGKKYAMNKTQEKYNTEKKVNIPDKKEDNGARCSRSKQWPQDKSSKLPPVCLRVDPLPKNKSANGSSRSSTLPSSKGERAQQDNKEQIPCLNGFNKEVPNKEIGVVDDVKDRTLDQNEKKVNQRTIPVVHLKGSSETVEELSQNKVEQKAKVVERKDSGDGKLNEGAHIVEENKADKEYSGGRKGDRKRHLSESDAAVLIQSAYRGYQVRRWQPLEKLRKIMHINKQVQDIRRQIQSFEVSHERLEMKQRMVVFGETIMNLLLQLDAIQGLLPSVREARKSVARELIHLQENLDCLGRESTSEHESATTEELVTDRNVKEQASAASIPPGNGPASDQLQTVQSAEGNHATEPAGIEKIEVDASVNKHVEMGAGGEEKKSESGESIECRDGVVSTACGDYKEALDDGEPIETELVSAEPVFRLDEATNPFIGNEMQEVPSANRDGVLFPKVEERGKMEGVSSVEVQLSGSQTTENNQNTKCDHDLEESSEISVARRYLEKAAESDLASNDMKMVEPWSGEQAPDSGIAQCTLMADTVRSPEQSSENSNLDPVIMAQESMASNSAVPADLLPVKLVSDSDLASNDMMVEPRSGEEAPDSGIALCTLADTERSPDEQSSENSNLDANSAVPAELSPVELVSDSDVVTPLTEEVQMVPIAEESCRAENEIKVNVADSTCEAVAVCLEAGSETQTFDDVVKVEKKLEMQESNGNVVKPDKNLGTQESLINRNLEHAAEDAFVVIESEDMPNFIGTPVEPCFDKVQSSKVEQEKPLLEDSLCSHVSEGADTKGTKEVEEGFSPSDISSPSTSLISFDTLSSKEKLMEDNEKLREMLQKLLEAGNKQLAIISDLDGRVKDLERKLAQKKRVTIKRSKLKKSFPNEVSC
ncbi:uncharacterized protein [Typha angustifolia]|uniref:uncharacterized protein isoform X1 n=2 Tax=Typha angustifolia TaxID=59011 RepID=UPI003C30E786